MNDADRAMFQVVGNGQAGIALDVREAREELRELTAAITASNRIEAARVASMEKTRAAVITASLGGVAAIITAIGGATAMILHGVP